MRTTSRVRPGVLAACAAAVLAAAVHAGLEWYRSRDVALSQAPPRDASPATVPDEVGTVGVRVRVPIDALRDTMDKNIPTTFDLGGSAGNACKDLGWLGKHCVGTFYEGKATRDGRLELTGDNTTLRASVPVRVEGKGGMRGSGAEALGLNAKNFSAVVNAKFLASVGLGAEWCPTVDGRASYEWIEGPKVEIVGGVWVNVGDVVEPWLNAELTKVPEQIREAIPCRAIQDSVRRVWRDHTFPVTVADGQTVYIRVDPIRVGFSGVTAAADYVRFSAVLTARTSVGTEPGPTGIKPGLPPLERAADEPGSIALSVPVRAGYGSLREALLREVAGKPFRVDTPTDPVDALVSNVDIYPADGGRLAVGAAFRVDIPGSWFDVSGRVYVTARPVVVGDELRLADIAFTRVLDNELWKAASVVFEGPVRQAIERGARLDIGPLARRAAQAVAEATADPARTAGVAFTLSDLLVTAASVVPEADALAVLVRIGATFEAVAPSVPQ